MSAAERSDVGRRMERCSARHVRLFCGTCFRSHSGRLLRGFWAFWGSPRSPGRPVRRSVEYTPIRGAHPRFVNLAMWRLCHSALFCAVRGLFLSGSLDLNVKLKWATHPPRRNNSVVTVVDTVTPDIPLLVAGSRSSPPSFSGACSVPGSQAHRRRCSRGLQISNRSSEFSQRVRKVAWRRTRLRSRRLGESPPSPTSSRPTILE